MKINKIQISKFGSAHSMEIMSENFDQTLDPYEVMVEVHYSGINFADIVMRVGMYQDAPPVPFTPGYEISGVVKSIGEKVSKYKIGDQVMAGTRFGGYSSLIKLKEWQLISLPQGFDLKDAAATPVTFFTAHLALEEFFRQRSGDKILIDCATGGVGVFCLQMAKAKGVHVIGLTSSSHKKEFIESFGAKAMTHEEFWNSDEKDFSFILNSTGGAKLKKLYLRLDKAGLLLCIGLQEAIKNGKSSFFSKMSAVIQTPWYPLLKLVMQSKAVAGFNALKFFEDETWMKKLMRALEENKFKPHVDKVFSYKEVGLAHEYLESKKAKGKVLLSWKNE